MIKYLEMMTFAVIGAVIVAVLSSKQIEIRRDSMMFEPIPLEEMVEHDIDIAFEEWEEDVDVEFDEEDIDLIARVVMSEASVLPYEAKIAVAQTVINRVRDGRWGETVEEVVYYKNAYSTQNNGEPNEKCYEAVHEALAEMPYPTDMFYFRTGHPHRFGYFLLQIGNTFFTTEGSNDDWSY